MRRKATVLRPSLAELGRLRCLLVSTFAYATPLARVGRQRVWSPCEDVTLRVGGPRTGKTGELACRILDAPGAVIATSTRTDLIDLTGPLRTRRGPVFVFNPSGVGDWKSSITFDPLSGCQDPSTAAHRAADLLAGVSAPGQGPGSGLLGRPGQPRARGAAARRSPCCRAVAGWVAVSSSSLTGRGPRPVKGACGVAARWWFSGPGQGRTWRGRSCPVKALA